MITEILSNNLYTNIDGIKTFGKYPTLQNETVPSHSWWVVFFTNMLIDEMLIENYINTIYSLKLSEFIHYSLNYATFHDYPENFTGDISFEVKYNEHNGTDIKKLIDEYENICMNKYILNNRSFKTLSKTMNNVHVKSFVKIADWLATIHKEINEIELGNKRFIDRIEISFDSILLCIDNFIKVNDNLILLDYGFIELFKQDLIKLQSNILNTNK